MYGKFYTGIGSRETPPEIMGLMETYANQLQSLGYFLRSGGANGADTAFENGAGKKKQIYLPWKGFNGRKSKRYDITDEALELAEQLHPYWVNLKNGAKKLMARNCYQVLGEDLETPSEFVICWTSDGCETHKDRKNKTGGTGQAISLANLAEIKVYNLANQESIKELDRFLESLVNYTLR